MDGIPPVKVDKKNGEPKHKVAAGKKGSLDLGVSTVAVTNEDMEQMFETIGAGADENLKRRICKLERHIDLKQRLNNPDNYNPDGTVRKGRKTWVVSNNQKKLKNKRRNAHRVIAHNRKVRINALINKILSFATDFKVEAMRIKGLQRRSRKTEISEKTGKFKRKSRFGKSIQNNAPGELKRSLKEKAERNSGSLTEINTVKVKASQFNHLTCKCRKKPLSQRWNEFLYKGLILRIQRDLYSSFIILCTDDAGDVIDIDMCNENFDKFIINHNDLIDSLVKQKQEGVKLPSCMGI